MMVEGHALHDKYSTGTWAYRDDEKHTKEDDYGFLDVYMDDVLSISPSKHSVQVPDDHEPLVSPRDPHREAFHSL